MASKTVFSIVFTIFIILSLTKVYSGPENKQITVAVTAPSLVSIVSAIGGDKIKVKSLIPPGADPHHYEPSETDIVNAVSDTALIVMTGPHHLLIEEKIEDLYKKGFIKSMIINYKDYIDNGMIFLKNPKTNDINPHGYFFSLNNSKIIAFTIYKALSEIDPEDKDYYLTRYNEFKMLIDSIYSEISPIRKSNLKIILLTPVLQYIAKDLNMEIINIVLPEYDIEPTEKDISEVINIMRYRKVNFVLVSDMEANRLRKMIDVLRHNNIKIIIAPVFTFNKVPYLAPLITSSVIISDNYNIQNKNTNENPLNYFLLPSIVLNLVLALITFLLYYKVKNYE